MLINELGGKVEQNYELRKSPDVKVAAQWLNTCTVKVCHALNRAGAPIPHPRELPSNIRALTSSDSGNYIYGIPDFTRYMNQTYGTPLTLEGSLSSIIGKQGIIVFENFHADLWDRNSMISNVGNAGRYIQTRKAFFWETPK